MRKNLKIIFAVDEKILANINKNKIMKKKSGNYIIKSKHRDID